MHHEGHNIIVSFHTNFLLLEQCYFQSWDRDVKIAIHIISLHCFFQRMQQEFQVTLSEAASAASKTKSEPHISTITDPSGSLPSWVLRTHWQHAADYTRLMMQGDMDLTMGEDRAAPC